MPVVVTMMCNAPVNLCSGLCWVPGIAAAAAGCPAGCPCCGTPPQPLQPPLQPQPARPKPQPASPQPQPRPASPQQRESAPLWRASFCREPGLKRACAKEKTEGIDSVTEGPFLSRFCIANCLPVCCSTGNSALLCNRMPRSSAARRKLTARSQNAVLRAASCRLIGETKRFSPSFSACLDEWCARWVAVSVG